MFPTWGDGQTDTARGKKGDEEMPSHAEQWSLQLVYSSRQPAVDVPRWLRHYPLAGEKGTWWEMKYVENQERAEKGASRAHAARDEDLAAMYPAVHEYITECLWDDGRQRQTATMTLFAEDGLFKVCLSDRATERVLWASGTTLLEVMADLEAALVSGKAEWRKAKRWNEGGKAGKRG